MPANYVRPATAGAPALVDIQIPADDRPAETRPATQPATAAGTMPAAAQRAEGEPLAISVQDAILIALEQNPSLRAQRLTLLISRTSEEDQRAAFDPTLSGQISGGRNDQRTNVENHTSPVSSSDSMNAQATIQQYFPTGTTIAANGTVNYSTASFYTDSTLLSAQGGLTVTQSLLRGADYQANLASLRQSQIDTKVSQYELRGFAESLLADVESTYWDYALAARQIEIFDASLKVAQDQLDQTGELIRVGRLAESERAAAEAEVALRKEDLINAHATLATTRLHLLQLLSPPAPGKRTSQFWTRVVTLKDAPFVPTGTLDDVDSHMNVALALRPDLNQARLQIQRDELDVVRTKNGLLPKMDLFVTLGKTGYAQSFSGSFADLDGPNYSALAGVSMSYPLGDRAPRADYRRATLNKEQANESLDNLTELAQVDVRTAHVEARRAHEQIAATTVTRIAQETAFKTESEKLRVGRSTSLLVSQTHRDLLQAQINEVSAVTTYLKDLVALYRLEGSLLARRHIEAPGGKAVEAMK